jgi:hypothetical protein
LRSAPRARCPPEFARGACVPSIWRRCRGPSTRLPSPRPPAS